MFSLTAVFRSLPQSTACNPLSQVVGSQPDAAKSLKIQLQVLKIAVSPRKLARPLGDVSACLLRMRHASNSPNKGAA